MENNKLGVSLFLEQVYYECCFFGSLRRHTRWNCDWSSDVCSSDLVPVSLFTCIFSLARTVGWIAQWQEMISDPEYKIGRPRQLYKGATRREVKPLDKR